LLVLQTFTDEILHAPITYYAAELYHKYDPKDSDGILSRDGEEPGAQRKIRKPEMKSRSAPHSGSQDPAKGSGETQPRVERQALVMGYSIAAIGPFAGALGY